MEKDHSTAGESFGQSADGFEQVFPGLGQLGVGQEIGFAGRVAGQFVHKGQTLVFAIPRLIMIADDIAQHRKPPNENSLSFIAFAVTVEYDLQGVLDQVLCLVQLHPSFGDGQESYTQSFKKGGLGPGVAGKRPFA